MKDNEIYYIEIICIIFLIIFVFLLFFNMSKNAPSKEQPNEYKESPPEPSKKQDMRDIKVRCPPKLTNLYEQDIPAMPNTNDIDVINKNTFNMYSSNKEIDNTNTPILRYVFILFRFKIIYSTNNFGTSFIILVPFHRF